MVRRRKKYIYLLHLSIISTQICTIFLLVMNTIKMNQRGKKNTKNNKANFNRKYELLAELKEN